MALEESSEAKTSRQPESEEESVDCPDCYDAMMRFYDWDNIRYVCENCDLIFSEFCRGPEQ
jgi:ribosomal protein S27E